MKFPKKWERIFKKFDNWSKLTKKLKEEKDFYPLEEYIFEPFKLTSPKKVQMVWIGQDPYSNDFHGEIVSHGLLFSTLIKDYIPPSLSTSLSPPFSPRWRPGTRL